jgi:hypothetical protein
MTAELFAPPDYWRLSAIAKGRICNGCGTKGLCGYLIPDTIWGLNITVACDIHDFMYSTGKTAEDKVVADRVFLYNMQRLIEAGWQWNWLKRRRSNRAEIYYDFVDRRGGPAFWKGKNQPEEMGVAA